jgi:Xaa-Pro aminopeptidase
VPHTCAGAEHDGYTADITRTFPASGGFSAAQRDIYALTLGLQQHALRLLRPAVSWAEVQASTRLLMLEQLQQLGLVASGSTEVGC